MTFDAIERSSYGGKPVALYEFIYGTQYWHYAAHDKPVIVGTHPVTGLPITWQPLAIGDGGFSMSGEPSDDTLTITCDATIPLANMLNGSPPSETIWVNVRRHHHGDTEAPIIWVGYVGSRKQRNSAAVDIRCKLLTAGFDRDGARLTYNRGCPHALYGVDCAVSKATFARTFQVTGVTGNAVVAPYLALLQAGWLTGGYLEWARFPGALERRGIEAHAGNTLTVIGNTAGIEVGEYVTAYPGCQHTRNDCAYKFNNLPNYGGFAHLPGKSPFSGDPVF